MLLAGAAAIHIFQRHISHLLSLMFYALLAGAAAIHIFQRHISHLLSLMFYVLLAGAAGRERASSKSSERSPGVGSLDRESRAKQFNASGLLVFQSFCLKEC